MFIFVLAIHFILCAVLVGLVLIQQGKGADMGAAFGAGGSNSLFGAGGATSLIVRITTATAVAFMITSILLINLSGSESGLAASSSSASAPSLEGSVMEPAIAPTAGVTTDVVNSEVSKAEPSTAAPQAVDSGSGVAVGSSQAAPTAAAVREVAKESSGK